MAKELYSVKEVATMVGVSEFKVRYDEKHGRIKKEDDCKPMKFSLESVKDYKILIKNKETKKAILDFNINERFKFLPASPRFHKMMNPEKYHSNICLAVGEYGTIINCNTMKKLKPYYTGNGHTQIDLQNGHQINTQVLVKMMWCDNGKFKSDTHHINGIKDDNRAINLVSVNGEEHKKAHKLLDMILSSSTYEELNQSLTEYCRFVEEIRKDNKEDIKEDLHLIDDIFFPSDSKHNRYMFVTEESYQKFLESNDENDLVIRGQYYC